MATGKGPSFNIQFGASYESFRQSHRSLLYCLSVSYPTFFGARARVFSTPLTFWVLYSRGISQSFLSGRRLLGGLPVSQFWRTPGLLAGSPHFVSLGRYVTAFEKRFDEPPIDTSRGYAHSPRRRIWPETTLKRSSSSLIRRTIDCRDHGWQADPRCDSVGQSDLDGWQGERNGHGDSLGSR
jgi:hypothetical protein